MRKPSAREAILNRYLSSDTVDIRPLYPKAASKSRVSTLEELYREVHIKYSQAGNHPYLHKNATEIEAIMRHNRSLIDSRRNLRK